MLGNDSGSPICIALFISNGSPKYRQDRDNRINYTLPPAVFIFNGSLKYRQDRDNEIYLNLVP